MKRLLTFGTVLALVTAGCTLLPSQDPGDDAVASPNASAPSPTGQSEPATPATPSAPAPTTPPASPTPDSPDNDSEGPPFTADPSPDSGNGLGPLVTLTDVRTGTHEGFDRVVFDLGGGGRAGWFVRYVDEARAQGSGDPVDVAGGAVLQVDLSHTGYPEDTGVAFYDGPRRLDGATVVAEIVLTGMYEGQTQLFFGVSEERPFRVHALEGRVILDILHVGVGG